MWYNVLLLGELRYLSCGKQVLGQAGKIVTDFLDNTGPSWYDLRLYPRNGEICLLADVARYRHKVVSLESVKFLLLAFT